MMACRRTFGDDVAVEIIDRHEAGETLVELVDRYGHRETVRRILLGQGYRDLIHVRCRACYCPACRCRRLYGQNMNIAEAGMWVTVRCVLCPASSTRLIGHVLRYHGVVLCDRCGPRRS